MAKGLEARAWARLRELAPEHVHMERIEATGKSGRPDLDWCMADGLAGRIELKAVTHSGFFGPESIGVRAEQAVSLRRWAQHGGLAGIVCRLHESARQTHWLFFPARASVAWCNMIRTAADQCTHETFPDTAEGIARMCKAWRRDSCVVPV